MTARSQLPPITPIPAPIQSPPAHLLCLKLLPVILLSALQIVQLRAEVTQPPSRLAATAAGLAGDSGSALLALLLALRGRLALCLLLGAPLCLPLLNLSLGVRHTRQQVRQMCSGGVGKAWKARVYKSPWEPARQAQQPTAGTTGSTCCGCSLRPRLSRAPCAAQQAQHSRHSRHSRLPPAAASPCAPAP